MALSACGLPRSGPSKGEILSGAVENGGDAHVIYVNNHVNRTANYTPAYGFSNEFLRAGTVGADDIRPGDTLGLMVWENVDDGLLTGLGQSSTELQQLQVDSQGYIFVPYAGRIRAAGNTPDQLREAITQRLESQTPDPQVSVTRVAGDGATVSVMGKVFGQGVYPIERPTRTLSSMLAKAGGVAVEPEVAVVTVKRGRESGKVWLTDLYFNPTYDIALRPGDVIMVEEDQRSFTALGALGGQTKVPLGNEQISAIEAIAMVGGLARVTQDVPPFVLIDGESFAVVGLNKVGLRRAGLLLEEVRDLKAAYQIFYRSGLTFEERLETISAEFLHGPAAEFGEFFLGGSRGFVRERRTPPGATIRPIHDAVIEREPAASESVKKAS